MILQTSAKRPKLWGAPKPPAPRPGDFILDPHDAGHRIEITRVLGREGELWRVLEAAGAEMLVGPGFTRRVWLRKFPALSADKTVE